MHRGRTATKKNYTEFQIAIDLAWIEDRYGLQKWNFPFRKKKFLSNDHNTQKSPEFQHEFSKHPRLHLENHQISSPRNPGPVCVCAHAHALDRARVVDQVGVVPLRLGRGREDRERPARLPAVHDRAHQSAQDIFFASQCENAHHLS